MDLKLKSKPFSECILNEAQKQSKQCDCSKRKVKFQKLPKCHWMADCVCVCILLLFTKSILSCHESSPEFTHTVCVLYHDVFHRILIRIFEFYSALSLSHTKRKRDRDMGFKTGRLPLTKFIIVNYKVLLLFLL